MSISELVTTHHLTRQAIIYIRQSTPHQVLTNQESLRLQYALKQRALSLGWRDDQIEIIDADLGLTGAAAQHREGFKELLAKVTLEQAGIIFSSEVTRLSRNCSDWYPLLDICAFKGCLIADRDGIYDPATPNGRLLLGLKGTLSEMELHTIRARMHASLINKAERGELALPLPIGLARDELGQVRKHPSREVQDRIALVFDTFLQRRAASKVLQYFNQQQLLLPVRDRSRELAWKPPTVGAILSILKNPAYAGAFVYGRTSTRPIFPGRPLRKSKPCFVTTMPNTLATELAASLDPDRRFYTGCSIAASALIRWLCNTHAPLTTSAITCVGNLVRLSANAFPAIPLIRPSSKPSFRLSLPSNWTSMRRPWRLTDKTVIKPVKRAGSRSNGYATRPHWRNDNSTAWIPITGSSRRNWRPDGRPLCAN